MGRPGGCRPAGPRPAVTALGQPRGRQTVRMTTPEDPAARLARVRHLLPRVLGAWAAASTVGGAALLAAGRRDHDAGRRAAGRQHLAWGLVDGALAVAAARGLAQPPTRTPEVDGARLRRLLLLNAAADVGYVAAGAAWARRVGPQARGAGRAVVLQGAALLALDVGMARRLEPLPLLSPAGSRGGTPAPHGGERCRAARRRRRGTG